MNRRQQILEWIRIAAYEGNDAAAIRLYTENRISFKSFQLAVSLGRRQKEAADKKTATPKA